LAIAHSSIAGETHTATVLSMETRQETLEIAM
jgi:hypothetical protein